MAADGGFDGGPSPDSLAAAAARAGGDYIDLVAKLAGYDPGAAISLITQHIEKVRMISDYAGLRVGSAGAEAVDPATGDRASQGGTQGGQESDLDDLGRNQRSRIREAVILDIIERNAAPCALQKLMTGLAGRRIVDTQAAVVSHLHRLKSNGLITQPGSGFYDITTDGLGHLRKLRASLGSLVS
ncbi:MAG: hypothetical protein WC807_10190 [Hyphomicrobium sp.]|jgi:hypothetical protein